MTAAALASLEAKRLSALHQSGLLDTPPEEIFDQWTKLASKVLKTPVVLMSLVDAERQFFKSQFGLPEEWAAKRETPLSHSFCQYVAASNEPLVISDAREHPLVRDNLAVRDIGVVAYAGIPLTTTGGETLGSFCAIDDKPRKWTSEEMEILHAMAGQAMTQVNLRIELAKEKAKLEQSLSTNQERETNFRQNVHDLRTPVTSVLVGLDAVEMAGPLSEEQRRYWEIAKANARALRDLANELLKIGSLEEKGAAALSTGECFPQAIVQRALDQVAPLAHRAGITIDTSALKSLPAIRADEAVLVRVVTNLLGNAVKFTPRGHRVAVRLDETGSNGTASICFSVKDEGIGIATQDQEAIFGDGVSLLNHEVGSGIGLAFCKRVVEAHGGEIKVESAIGSGSTFSFFIPQGH